MKATKPNLKAERQKEFELMQKISGGDLEAFAEFNEQYKRLISTTIYKVLNHYEDTQDVTSEVLATIWNKADKFTPGKGSLVTWICTTSRNRAIDRLRSVQRKSALYDRYEDKMKSEAPDDVSCGRSEVYRKDARSFLQNAVVTLTKEQREVIELAYFEGFTQRQIAEKTDLPIGSVKSRIRRGMEKLKVMLDDTDLWRGQRPTDFKPRTVSKSHFTSNVRRGRGHTRPVQDKLYQLLFR